MNLWKRFEKWGHQLSSPKGFDRFALYTSSWLTPLAWLTLIAALIWGLAFAPSDETQGHVYRIIFIHVPAAALSMSVFVMIAIASIIFFVWRIKLAALFARSAAPYGALMTALALVTGAIWGKPTWGTYWTWDARLTSELILLFIYFAYILLQSTFEDRNLGDKMSAIVAIIGLINIPIIHYSVTWWNSLHQGATIFKLAAPSIAPSMLYPLLLSLLAFYLLFAAYVIKQIQNIMLEMRIYRSLE